MTEEKRKELEERKDNALDLFLDAWLTDVFMLMTDRQLDDVKEEIERHISIRRHLKAIDCMVTETDIWYMNQEKLEERNAQTDIWYMNQEKLLEERKAQNGSH